MRHATLTANVGGIKAALFNALDTDAAGMMLQQHRNIGPGLPGVHSAAMAKG